MVEWKNRGGGTPSRNRHMGAITAAAIVVVLKSDSKSSLVENQARLVSQCATESC